MQPNLRNYVAVLSSRGRSKRTFTLEPLALKLAIPPHCLGPLARPLFRRFFVMAPEFHLAENALTLHSLLQYLQRLVDVVVANGD